LKTLAPSGETRPRESRMSFCDWKEVHPADVPQEGG
jgi:hypothetical protein